MVWVSDEMESFSETLEFPPFQNYLGVGIGLNRNKVF